MPMQRPENRDQRTTFGSWTLSLTRTGRWSPAYQALRQMLNYFTALLALATWVPGIGTQILMLVYTLLNETSPQPSLTYF